MHDFINSFSSLGTETDTKKVHVIQNIENILRTFCENLNKIFKI